MKILLKIGYLFFFLDVSKPKTKCEFEREEALKKSKKIPDIFVPVCSKYDGLYVEIQRSMFGIPSSWCVDRFSGKAINSTVTMGTNVLPMCPSKIVVSLSLSHSLSLSLSLSPLSHTLTYLRIFVRISLLKRICT